MRTCFPSHHATATAFADPTRDPASSGRTAGENRVWFQGDKIYSYGKHFCIARLDHETRTALMTTRKYSVSTSKHKSHVSSALYRAGWTVVSVEDPENLPVKEKEEAFVW